MSLNAILRSSALALVTATGLASVAQADTYKWITFKPQGAGDAQAITTQWLVDQFAERTGGKHSIEVFWGGSVAKTREIPEALAAGVGDFGDIITPYFPDLMPLNNAVGFFIPQPMNTLEVGQFMEEMHATYPQFGEELASQNIHAFGFRPLEDYGLLCTKPVKSAADMKGLRIRSYGFAYPKLIEALGASPVSIATSEAYEALQRSIIDCTPIGPALARGWKYDEVAKYYIEVPLGASFGHLLAMNLDSYNGMDDETKAVVDQLGKDYLVEYARVVDEDAARVRELWKGDLGVEVIPFPKEELLGVLEDAGVQEVRQEWIDKANALGVPAEEIAKNFGFDTPS
ncbi:TRAP transporter substrate-binding protein DctP [Alloyangia pacifica]|uniref:TRAP-type C4-dicarboxylate transport system, substrate-binding protein n=1 Tax=Alloyangia pacifica TaxID=311180 RepID=A0A1I6VWU5_9RHOB|nr:TRAP transporter substrate-binding protein DctP [Alloyangia pacifica]SDI23239.1 TRAP-type C4-dicarboxylate transport system, substrate-binding protein [Alloyangia pacifica]SFT17894.1 TRAP-type C4-dicarboxylate transport system, substrate-binding protein [Alloyangia pacifica]